MRSSLLSFLGGVAFAAGAFVLAGMQSGGPGTAISGDLREFLSAIDMVTLTDDYGHSVRTIRITGNVQIVNGTGNTYTTNGSGNLIVGYGEDPAFGASSRGGSHNLMLGMGNGYTAVSYGGIVAGRDNLLSEIGSSIIGGQGNRTTGPNSVIVAGRQNRTQPAAANSAILGGLSNLANDDCTTVAGGEQCGAAGFAASVGGGLQRSVLTNHDWRAGSLFEDQ